MSDTSKLTSEQVADFERRAAAGEKPVLEWCHWPTAAPEGEKEISVIRFLHDTAIRIYWPSPKRRATPKDFFMCFGVMDCGDNPAFANGDFDTLIAAQLTAEHLLAEATRALHESSVQEDVARLKELLATQHGNNPVCGDHWHGLSGHAVNGSEGCPWCLCEKLKEEEEDDEKHLRIALGTNLRVIAERDALRARVAELESRLASAHDAAGARHLILEAHAKRVTELETALIQERADHARTAWARSRFTNDSEPEDGAIQHYVRTDIGGDKVNRWELVHEDEEGNVHWTEMGMGATPHWTPEARAIVDAAMAAAKKEGGNG